MPKHVEYSHEELLKRHDEVIKKRENRISKYRKKFKIVADARSKRVELASQGADMSTLRDIDDKVILTLAFDARTGNLYKPHKPRSTKSKFISLLSVAKQLGCQYDTLSKWLQDAPSFAKTLPRDAATLQYQLTEHDLARLLDYFSDKIVQYKAHKARRLGREVRRLERAAKNTS
jgi:hypothetical protein